MVLCCGIHLGVMQVSWSEVCTWVTFLAALKAPALWSPSGSDTGAWKFAVF